MAPRRCRAPLCLAGGAKRRTRGRRWGRGQEVETSRRPFPKNVTRVFNIHSTDKTHGLGADGLAWVTGTAPQFAADLERDPAYAHIQAEYRYYYAPAPIAAIANRP
jgi:hypothetical protein